MGAVIGFKLETVSQERRDEFLIALIALIENQMGGGDKVTMTHELVAPNVRGKQQIKSTIEWKAGEPTPMLRDLGIYFTQADMFHALDRIGQASLVSKRTLVGKVDADEPPPTSTDVDHGGGVATLDTDPERPAHVQHLIDHGMSEADAQGCAGFDPEITIDEFNRLLVNNWAPEAIARLWRTTPPNESIDWDAGVLAKFVSAADTQVGDQQPAEGEAPGGEGAEGDTGESDTAEDSEG